jgi:hypothetical protein
MQFDIYKSSFLSKPYYTSPLTSLIFPPLHPTLVCLRKSVQELNFKLSGKVSIFIGRELIEFL